MIFSKNIVLNNHRKVSKNQNLYNHKIKKIKVKIDEIK
jgi:hypothetical protein